TRGPRTPRASASGPDDLVSPASVGGARVGAERTAGAPLCPIGAGAVSPNPLASRDGPSLAEHPPRAGELRRRAPARKAVAPRRATLRRRGPRPGPRAVPAVITQAVRREERPHGHDDREAGADRAA